ncbi:MAG: glycosyltransferase family 4 protein, partial [Firmicutes bacterium]|nr:glycosyltransferase family 4 protein [Candidatus Caballimonas caccae]
HEHGRGNNSFHLIWNYFSFALSGKRYIKKLDKDFDVVLIIQLSPVMLAWPGIKYAKKYNKKTLLYCYDLWPASLIAGGIKKESFIYKVFKKISKKVYDSVDKIAVTSKSFIDYFKQEHNIDKNKLTYIPQYCEDLFLDINPKINDGVFNYVFAGNIGTMQSVETIIKAANIIRNDNTIKIHIVGEGRDLDKCKKLAKDLGLTNITFYGRKPIEEMPKFYAIADAMIVSLAKDDLISKTLPGKVQSIMAAGKPIIASIDGEANLVIKESNCGLVSSAEDYVSLAKNMEEFKTKDATIFAQNSLKYFNKNFKKEIVIKKLISELEI